MKIACVIGGWHFPLHPYRALSAQADVDVDLYCVGHRSPDSMEVFREKDIIDDLDGSDRIVELDRELYEYTATSLDLKRLGWRYIEAANTVGDWGFLNQWLDWLQLPASGPAMWGDYPAILFAHDDTYIRRRDLFPMIRATVEENPDTLLWTNGRYPEAPKGYARGSFEIFTPKLIEMLGGRIPLAETGLDRTGKTDTPVGMDALSAWNANGEPLRHFMNSRGLKVGYLSEYYRVSDYVIEGERGFLHRMGGAPWSYNKGVKALGVTA